MRASASALSPAPPTTRNQEGKLFRTSVSSAKSPFDSPGIAKTAVKPAKKIKAIVVVYNGITTALRRSVTPLFAVKAVPNASATYKSPRSEKNSGDESALARFLVAPGITKLPMHTKDNHLVGEVSPPKQRWPISDHGLLPYQRYLPVCNRAPFVHVPV